MSHTIKPSAPLKLTGITRMGIREYRQEIPRVIREEQPVLIERHGHPVGLYLPLRTHDEARETQTLQALEGALSDLQQQTGLGEEALARLVEDAWRETD